MARSPIQEIRFHLHAHYLHRHILKGSRVLEVGAGAGRFTQILAALGCKIVVTDISSVQLELNRKHASELGFASAIEEWRLLDMCDMQEIPSETFDGVVCYGGPLSYVFEDRDQALDECIRVTRSSGVLLFSVMSLWGTVHAYLAEVLKTTHEHNVEIIRTGDITPETQPESQHYCHMYRAQEFRDLLKKYDLEILDMSASNAIATRWNEQLAEVRQNPEKWVELLEMEIEACAEEGCLDLGTHIIAVTRKP